MIKGNILEFGYGDIAVGASNLLERITFTNIKPPIECGLAITEDMDIEYGEQIIIQGDGTYDLYNIFKTVSRENRIVEYRGYTFDFTNYNEESVRIVLKHSRDMVNTMILAC